jgi:hypothetical protein
MDMHTPRIDRAEVRLAICTGLDWTDKYPAISAALCTLSGQIYLALRGSSRWRHVLRQ